MRKAHQTKGIFSIEGIWDSDLRLPSTVRPMLELIRMNGDIKYIHRECAVREELEYYLEQYRLKRYDAYPILYLAFHGSPGSIYPANDEYPLDDLATTLEDRCNGCIILISSCSVLDIDRRHLKRFLRTTAALAICGYRNDVDWMLSSAFDLLILNIMQENEFSGRGIDSIEEKCRGMARSFPELAFRMVTQKDL